MLLRNIFRSSFVIRPFNIFKYNTAGNIFYRTFSSVLRYKQIIRHQHTFSTIIVKPNQNNIESEVSNFNSFAKRTHTCGELRPTDVRKKVTLCGWVHFVRLSKFLIVRDTYGVTQCIVGASEININNLPVETIVQIDGTVVARPLEMINKQMPTGEVEVVINKIIVLNEVCKLPFNLRDYQKPKEQIRLQYRYIDLRFPEMQSILRQRSSMLHKMRKFLLEKHNFVEVETPTLFCRTPGGAREFVVPTHYSGLFYSLVQSPQQFKQMLMAGGVDRYFQVARCYRDETTRPDRQPEFTQLDIELSFTSLENILAMVELLLHETFLKDLPPPPFKRMTYQHALENYGSDKPNITYEMLLRNVTHLFQFKDETNFGAFIVSYPREVGKLTSKYKEKILNLRKKYEVKVVLNENITKEFGEDLHNQIKSAETHNIVCIGDRDDVCMCLGDIRTHLAELMKSKNLLVVKDSYEPLWVIDFPLFTKGENGLMSCHHPFTAPHPDDIHLLETYPLKVRSLAYDIVLNGNEIGGGSIRIHNAHLQEQILHMLDIDPSSLSHFIGALRSGCPPHGGIALGIDRLISIACQTESIRDVIAFPKSHEGRDPLSGAPNSISNEDQKYYNIKTVVS